MADDIVGADDVGDVVEEVLDVDAGDTAVGKLVVTAAVRLTVVDAGEDSRVTMTA